MFSFIMSVFELLQEAMDIVRIPRHDQEAVFTMLAAVLWLGNISFLVIDSENHVDVVADEGNATQRMIWVYQSSELQGIYG